ncbi:MAG: FIST signal transduction protein, partial [Planctomycetota bacterium]
RRLLRPDLRGVFLLSDGLRVNGSELVRGANSVLPEPVPVTGGLAGDRVRFRRTWVLEGGEPQDGSLCGVGFYGERIEIGHGSKGGWDRFGPERLVTRSEGNVLFELDGRPALELYKAYLGERASGLPATALLFPLALRENATQGKSLVRTILAVDEGARSLTFAGDVPQGSLAQLMHANFDRLVDGAEGAASMTRRRCESGRPTLAIAISCVGRRLVLGERTEEELEAVGEALPPDARVVGFYSYGEISPFASGRSDLHNQTMTLTTFQERG